MEGDESMLIVIMPLQICLGKINGAKYASLKELQARGYINEHILALKNAQSKYEE